MPDARNLSRSAGGMSNIANTSSVSWPRSCAGREAARVNPDRASGLPSNGTTPSLRMLDLVDQPSRGSIVGGDGLLRRVHRDHGQSVGVHDADDLVTVMRRAVAGDGVAVVGAAVAMSGEAVLRTFLGHDEVGAADRGAEAGPEPRLQQAHRHTPAVTRGIDVVARIAAPHLEPRRAAAARALHQAFGQRDVAHGDQAIVHGQVQMAALPGPVPPAQRRKDADRRDGSRSVVRSLERRHGHAVHLEHPGQRLDRQVVPGDVRPWPVLAEPRDRTVDDRRVHRPRARLVDAELGRHAAPEALDHDVRPAEQALRDGMALGLVHRQPEKALVAVDAQEIRALAAETRWVVAAGITHSRALHLDHVGAQIGQHLRRPRPRQQAAEIGDAHAGERQVVGRHQRPSNFASRFLQEGGDALLLVARAIDGGHQIGLEFQRRGEIHLQAAMHGALDEGEAERATPLVDGGHGQRRAQRLATGHQAVHQSDAMRLLRVDRLGREQHVERAGRTDEARQPLRAAGARHRADARAGNGEGRPFGRHAHVASQRQLAAAGHAEALDRGDDRLGRGFQRVVQPVPRAEVARAVGGGLHLHRLGQVRTGREVARVRR